MARKATLQNHKFSDKLILNQWLMSQFGIDPLLDYKDRDKPFHKLAAPIRDSRLEAYTAFTMNWSTVNSFTISSIPSAKSSYEYMRKTSSRIPER